MASDRLVRRLPRRLAGASAVEFALIFPLVFAMVYGGIVYGYIYFLQQRINFLAQEAVRAAIAVAPGDDAGAYLAAAQNQANIAIANNFSLAGVGVPTALTVSFDMPDPNTLRALVTYSLTTPTLFPTIAVPGVGTIPPLPPSLIATAAGRLS
ncbi:TadE family protein [Nevskia sp.]|uniref:TadE/TadG family type IV pilus assembly protein n=1 Tax=Nevskia sp. TaxID=1929292 RepID=UPI0025F30F42|nr:TadE family protein [Nevskia sp.]